MNLIAFNGKMGVGKSTAIARLIQHTSRIVLSVKFAQPLYDIQEYIYKRIASVYQRPSDFVKDRKLLQWVGTHFRDELGQTDIWMNIWKAEVEMLRRAYPAALIVCDDCRYDNEAAVVRQLGGVVVSITDDRAASRTVSGIANHSSEAGISPALIHHTIQNNGTLEEFQESLRVLFQELVGRSDSAA